MAGGERTWDSAPVVVGLELANYAGMLAWALPLAVLSTPAGLLVLAAGMSLAATLGAALVARRGETRRLRDLEDRPPASGEVVPPARTRQRRGLPLLAAHALLLVFVLWTVTRAGTSATVVAALLPAYVAFSAARRREQLAWERRTSRQPLLPARYGGSRDGYAWRPRPAATGPSR